MLCTKCGIELPDQARFCHKCGASVARPDEPIAEEDRDTAEEGRNAAEEDPPATEPDPTPRPVEETKPMPGFPGKTVGTDKEEEELWTGGFSGKAMIGTWVLCGVVTVLTLVGGILLLRSFYGWLILLAAILVMWLAVWIRLKYRQWSVRYRLTNRRLVHEKGILRRVTDRIEVIDMDDITFEQGFFQRLVGVGTIRIRSSDVTDPRLVLDGIDNVRNVADKIDTARRKERMTRGVFVENG